VHKGMRDRSVKSKALRMGNAAGPRAHGR